MRRLIRIVLVILIGALCSDVLGRLLLQGSTNIKFVRSALPHNRVLFVHFPGILTGRTRTGIVSVWKQYGDVMLVEYTGRRFKGDQIAQAVAGEIDTYASKYDTVVFIGSSMGGLVAYDVYQLLLKDETDFRFILVDAPTRRADLQSPLDKISLGSYLWWAGPVSNLLSSLYFKSTFVKPKEENIEPGVDRDQLADYVREQMSHPLSWAMDQNRYIIGHDPVRPVSLEDARVVYVRSTRDNDTVRAEAYAVWNQAANGMAEYLEVDSTHVGYAERPSTWRDGFHWAIAFVLS